LDGLPGFGFDEASADGHDHFVDRQPVAEGRPDRLAGFDGGRRKSRASMMIWS
jgi:hypothetical protein